MKRLVALVLCALALPAAGQEAWTDPYVPPHVLKRAGAPPAETRGEALRTQVEAKLRAEFDAAAGMKSGTLTREQARAAGFGFVAGNFDAIDTRRAGAITFEDLKRYLGLGL